MHGLIPRSTPYPLLWSEVGLGTRLVFAELMRSYIPYAKVYTLVDVYT